jgi:monovalent cation/proton antiporter MnhG/PhaG subunit
MPDLFTRMQPATKAATLGVGCMLTAVAVHFWDLGVTSRALAGVAFVVLTAPVSAHVIGRAAHLLGVPLWEKTLVDELRSRDRAPRQHVAPARDEVGTGEPVASGLEATHGEPTPDRAVPTGRR